MWRCAGSTYDIIHQRVSTYKITKTLQKAASIFSPIHQVVGRRPFFIIFYILFSQNRYACDTHVEASESEE